MEIRGSFAFAAPPEEIWPLLLEPDTLRHILPGCRQVARPSEDLYTGELVVQVGPLAGEYEGQLHLTHVQPARGYNFTYALQSQHGRLQGHGHIHLEPRNGRTLLHYYGQTEVSGALARHALPFLQTNARALVRQSLERFDQILQTGAGALPPSTTGWPTVPLYRQPSAIYLGLALFAATLLTISLLLIFWRKKKNKAHLSFTETDHPQ